MKKRVTAIKRRRGYILDIFHFFAMYAPNLKIRVFFYKLRKTKIDATLHNFDFSDKGIEMIK